MSTITKYAGNNVTLELPVKDAAGANLNVSSGYVSKLTLTKYSENAPALSLTSASGPGATQSTLGDGLVTWRLLAADTTTLGHGKFYGTITIVRSSDDFEEDYPIAPGGPFLLHLRRKDRP